MDTNWILTAQPWEQVRDMWGHLYVLVMPLWDVVGRQGEHSPDKARQMVHFGVRNPPAHLRDVHMPLSCQARLGDGLAATGLAHEVRELGWSYYACQRGGLGPPASSTQAAGSKQHQAPIKLGVRGFYVATF